MKTIAIIPAKGESLRLPRKNVREFCGCPLFLLSAFYARQEGVEPIVSTDCEEVRQLCRAHGVRWVDEVVDERSMANCVRQVLDKVECDAWALLQPTSPLRVRGMLRRMLRALEDRLAGSLYSAMRIKPVGMWKHVFLKSGRDQDTPDFFYFFDGSMVACTLAHWQQVGDIFSSLSVPVCSHAPCSMQIDTATDWEILHTLAEHGLFSRYLPEKPLRRICVVSNAPESARDWGAEIDGMDEVWRVNKLENIDKGFTGRRCDVVVLTVGPIYRTFTPEQQHLKELCTAKKIWLHRNRASEGKEHMARLGFANWAVVPEVVHARTRGFTTLGLAIALAMHTQPDAQIYYCGTISAATRTHGHRGHSNSGETEWLRNLIARGKIIHLNTDPA